MPSVLPFVLQNPAPQSQTAQNPSQAFDLNVASGSLLILFFSWANTSGSVTGVTDTIGNNWQQVDFQQVSGTLRTLYCFAAKNSEDGPCTVTVSTDQSRTYTFQLYEVSAALSILDGSPVHTNTTVPSTNPATGVLTTHIPGSIVFAASKSGNIATNPGTPWVSEASNNFGTSYQIVPAMGSFSAAWTCASSTWATTILAFQGAVGQNVPLGPYPIISDLPVSAGLLASPAALQSSIVGMVSYRSTWKVVQKSEPSSITNDPSDPSFDWTFLDQAVAQANYYHKLFSFHVAIQGFGQPNWVKNNALQYVYDASKPSLALYWDNYYQTALIALIQAMGTRYGQYPNLYKTVWTICSKGGSWDVPHKAADIAALTAPPYNYTTSQIVAAQKAITAAAAGAFPRQYIQLQVGRSGNLDIYPGGPSYDTNASTQIAQWAYANIPKFAMDKDGFSPRIDSPAEALSETEQSEWYILAQPLAGSTNTSGTTGTIPKGGSVFGQQVWPAVDQSGQYTSGSTNGFLANGRVPYTDPVPIVLGTIAAARAYNLKVLEIYDQDIVGVLLAPSVTFPGTGTICRLIDILRELYDQEKLLTLTDSAGYQWKIYDLIKQYVYPPTWYTQRIEFRPGIKSIFALLPNGNRQLPPIYTLNPPWHG